MRSCDAGKEPSTRARTRVDSSSGDHQGHLDQGHLDIGDHQSGSERAGEIDRLGAIVHRADLVVIILEERNRSASSPYLNTF
jgi:hypothetical protein